MTRESYTAFVERHEIAWELTMGALTLVWVALGFLIDQLGEGLRPDLDCGGTPGSSRTPLRRRLDRR